LKIDLKAQFEGSVIGTQGTNFKTVLIYFKGIEAYEFLRPTLLQSEASVVYAHSKKQWDLIQVGYGSSNQVRFSFSKKAVDTSGFVVDAKQTIVVQHEIPLNYEIVEKFEDENWKGVTLRLLDFSKQPEEEFTMS